MDINDLKAELMTLISGCYDDNVIYESLKKHRDSGMTKDEMYSVLESLRAEMRSTGDEAKEDKLMEFMDLIVGYCNNQWNLFP